MAMSIPPAVPVAVLGVAEQASLLGVAPQARVPLANLGQDVVGVQ